MKNYYFSFLTFFVFLSLNSQIKPLIINNNTNYAVHGRVGIYSTNNCNDYMYASIQGKIMPNSSVTYEKFENTNLSVPPITNYLSNGSVIDYNDPLLASTGLISNNTDWGLIDLLLTDSSNNSSIDNFIIGVFKPSCGRKPLVLQYGTNSTAEWIVYPTHHEVNIY